MLSKELLADGIRLLRQPILPLVNIVQFLYLTGDFADPDEVIAQLPPEIETGYAVYHAPGRMLRRHVDLFQPLVDYKAGVPSRTTILDPTGNPVDGMTAATSLVAQAVLTRELEAVNSALCAPCGCTLCCVGPTADMVQSYFEIPLASQEGELFAVAQVDTGLTCPVRFGEALDRSWNGGQVDDLEAPTLLRWHQGASLILPRGTACPHLAASGGCLVYPDRPEVCRKPQIFAYVLEAIGHAQIKGPLFCLRRSILAVVDCPYVELLRDEIAAYAAACELEPVFRRNKA